MKNRIFLIIASILLSVGLFAQSTVTVEANNDDISDHLDLKALGIIFGKAKNLEEFEQMINDWNNPISNLDLNFDGEVDYLRVLEAVDNGTNIIIVQAVLAKDIYQDVATIIVTRKNNKPIVQIVGDPYIYGRDYIIEPVYIYTPVIYSWFWGPTYVTWYSPYYWGYYPVYYRPYHHVAYYDYDLYMRSYYRNYHYVSYRYSSNVVYDYRDSRAYHKASRRDYINRYPDRSFERRNASRSYSVNNRRDIEKRRNIERLDNNRRGVLSASKSGRYDSSMRSNTSRNRSENIRNNGANSSERRTISNSRSNSNRSSRSAYVNSRTGGNNSTISTQRDSRRSSSSVSRPSSSSRSSSSVSRPSSSSRSSSAVSRPSSSSRSSSSVSRPSSSSRSSSAVSRPSSSSRSSGSNRSSSSSSRNRR